MKNDRVYFWSVVDGIEDISPPKPAKDFVPQWWKNTPKHSSEDAFINRSSTVKACPSFYDIFHLGYVLPMWTDTLVKIDEETYSITRSDDRMPISGPHGDAKYHQWLPDNEKERCVKIIKFVCPWKIKTPAGYSIFQLPMFYHFNPDFEVLPGIIWTDICHQLNPQMRFKRFGEFMIKLGTPMCLIVPFRRETDSSLPYEVIKRNEECIELENKEKSMIYTTFQGGYKRKQNELNKCPNKKGSNI